MCDTDREKKIHVDKDLYSYNTYEQMGNLTIVKSYQNYSSVVITLCA